MITKISKNLIITSLWLTVFNLQSMNSDTIKNTLDLSLFENQDGFYLDREKKIIYQHNNLPGNLRNMLRRQLRLTMAKEMNKKDLDSLIIRPNGKVIGYSNERNIYNKIDETNTSFQAGYEFPFEKSLALLPVKKVTLNGEDYTIRNMSNMYISLDPREPRIYEIYNGSIFRYPRNFEGLQDKEKSFLPIYFQPISLEKKNELLKNNEYTEAKKNKERIFDDPDVEDTKNLSQFISEDGYYEDQNGKKYSHNGLNAIYRNLSREDIRKLLADNLDSDPYLTELSIEKSGRIDASAKRKGKDEMSSWVYSQNFPFAEELNLQPIKKLYVFKDPNYSEYKFNKDEILTDFSKDLVTTYIDTKSKYIYVIINNSLLRYYPKDLFKAISDDNPEKTLHLKYVPLKIKEDDKQQEETIEETIEEKPDEKYNSDLSGFFSGLDRDHDLE